MPYERIISEATGKPCMRWVPENPSPEPTEEERKATRDYIDQYRPANCYCCGHPTKYGQTGCSNCNRSFVG